MARKRHRPAPPRTVRVSLPLDDVLDAERSLLPLFREAVPGFRMTRDVFAAALFEHAHIDLMQEYYVGKGKERRLMPGPDRENVMAVARSYIESLFEERLAKPRAKRRRRAK